MQAGILSRSTGQILDYELGSERCPLVPDRREDLVVTIDDLSADIVREHLADHAIIASVYGSGIRSELLHLCNRPLHLKMIMRVVDANTSAEELNKITTRHALYDRYVSKSISWDAERPGAVPHDPRERRAMCEALAAQMLNEGATIIDEELVARAIARARLEFGRDTDLVSRDLLRSTLLQTSGQERCGAISRTVSSWALRTCWDSSGRDAPILSLSGLREMSGRSSRRCSSLRILSH